MWKNVWWHLQTNEADSAYGRLIINRIFSIILHNCKPPIGVDTVHDETFYLMGVILHPIDLFF